MMESAVNTERSARESLAARGGLRACPHCGGNVRKIRDIYGAYLQCLQCSREVEPAMLVGSIRDPHPARHAEPTVEERLIA